MRSKAASRAALAELRANRASGRSRLETFEIDEDGPLYDEVDDVEYKNIVRKRLDDDDFVVDDNGAGYADDGREEWDDERYHYAESESDEDTRVGGKSGICLPSSFVAYSNILQERENVKKTSSEKRRSTMASADTSAPKLRALHQNRRLVHSISVESTQSDYYSLS